MKAFWTFIKESVDVFFDKYENDLQHYINDFAERTNDEIYSHQSVKIDFDELYKLLASIGYKRANELVTALQSKNKELTNKLLVDLYNFRKTSSYSDDYWKAYKLIRVAENQIDYESLLISPEKAKDYYLSILEESRKNIEFIKQQISAAIDRANNWGGTKVSIRPHYDQLSEPVAGASVKVDDADMTVFLHDNKLIVEDVLDFGDTDFFKNETAQNDYFLLVRELKNPGSTSAAGKLITLYTARPVADREMYEKAAAGSPWVPAGIFLSNSPDHVAGLASDLSSETRDVWRVKIDSNKVILTNDTPAVKYYQVIGSGKIPVKSLLRIS